MPDLFQPLGWSDGASGGTPLTSARGPSRWESGIDALDTALDAMADQVNSLQASVAAATSGAATPFGPTASRPAPAVAAEFYDTDLHKPIYGDGTAWRDAAGTVLSGAGGSNAPTGMTAVVQPDNSIVLNWTAPVGVTVTSYKLYEIRSPTGVSGAGALTTTTSTRTPSTTGNYEYWVTALVSGVESATSNHAICSLPYGSTPTGGGGGGSSGGGTAGSPAALLALGSTGGYFNEGIGFNTGHVDIDYPTLIGGYTNTPYFCLNGAADAVQFRVNMDGKTTSSNTRYARSELRELKSDGSTKAAWIAASGTHVMQYTFKLIHLQPNKPWVTIGQIHDASSDALSIKMKGSTTSALSLYAVLYDVDQTPALISSYTLGDTHTIKIELIGGTLKVYVDGTVKLTSSALSAKTAAAHYFKLGVYPQSLNNYGGFESSTEYCMAEISNLSVTHSPAL